MPESRVLVIGAGGFLGSCISTYLKCQAWNVMCLDKTPPSPSFMTDDRYVVCALPSQSLNALVESWRPETIVFAAGTSSVAASVENPAADFQNSVGVLLSVLETIRTLGTDTKVLFLSSASVYGNQDRLPIREDARLKPVSPYGYHKLISELLLEEYQHSFGVRSCVLRIFSAYGPGLRRQLLWDVSQKALSEREVILDGDGSETRDFIHGDDIARAVEIVLDRAEFSSEKYNLAAGEEVRVSELASKLVRALGTECPVRFTGKHRVGDPLRWLADTTSIRELGFRTAKSLDDGLAGFAKWVLKQKEPR
jgi:UDP-glucose 4-epimerase